MAEVAAGAAVLGAGMSAYGMIKASQDEAAAREAKQASLNMQADELESRQRVNEALMQNESEKMKLAFGAAYAASGKAGTGIGSQLEIQRQTDLQALLQRREAHYQARVLRAGGSLEGGLAASVRSAMPYTVGGSLLTSGSHIASNWKTT